MILDSETRKCVELMLFEYPMMLNRSAMAVVEWAQSNMAVRYDKPKVMGGDNKKEDVLCNVIDNDLKDYQKCIVVEKVLSLFAGQTEEKTLRAFYFERKSVLQTCEEVYISQREFYNHKADIIEATYLFAKELGVIE